MTIQTKTIGRLPVYLGDYDNTRSYGKKNRVTLYGSEFESKHDNNNTAPATWDGAETITFNTTDWQVISNGTDAWIAGNDKPASSEEFPYNGMGKVVLKKNIVNGVNVLTEDAFYTDGSISGQPLENTIFVIKYDFVLGEDIEIPANSMLEFDGGSLSGAYTITGTNTGINAGLVKIFNTNVTLSGTWNVVEAYPEWFGAKGDGVTDDTNALQSTLNSFFKTVLTSDKYLVNEYTTGTDNKKYGLIIPTKHCLTSNRGKSEELYLPPYSCTIITSNIGIDVIIGMSAFCKITDIAVKGSIDTDQKMADYAQVGIGSYNGISKRIIIDNVAILYTKTAFDLVTWNTQIINCYAQFCNTGFRLTNDGTGSEGKTGINIRGCVASKVKSSGFVLKRLTYSSLVGCAVDGLGSYYDSSVSEQKSLDYAAYAYTLDDCYSVTLISCGTEYAVQLLNFIGNSYCTIMPISHWLSSSPTLVDENKYNLINIGGRAESKPAAIGNVLYPIQISTTVDNYKVTVYSPSYSRNNILHISNYIDIIDPNRNPGDPLESWRLDYNVPFAVKNTSDLNAYPMSPKGMGTMVFNKQIGKPIWWDGTEWVDATGTPV